MQHENNLVEWLSETHGQFILAYLEREQQREAAIIDRFLAEKQLYRSAKTQVISSPA
jgi:ribonuclease HIII